MGLCCVSVGVGRGSNISEGRGQRLISEGRAVTFMGQDPEVLQASGVVVVAGTSPEGSGSLLCVLVQWCTNLGIRKTNRSSREKSAFCTFCVLHGNQIRCRVESFPAQIRDK